ncbi:hypothetical protein F2Q68_00038748 [Brassica cretica]|uniref:Uncharacterized protein n=1 Tax=Brassica cretica TaxID=69181 RepID=A0A8S9MSE2_BRACR|nr:hypothetical protein F2Q68_00038748 [Brassica cretica]
MFTIQNTQNKSFVTFSIAPERLRRRTATDTITMNQIKPLYMMIHRKRKKCSRISTGINVHAEENRRSHDLRGLRNRVLHVVRNVETPRVQGGAERDRIRRDQRGRRAEDPLGVSPRRNRGSQSSAAAPPCFSPESFLSAAPSSRNKCRSQKTGSKETI